MFFACPGKEQDVETTADVDDVDVDPIYTAHMHLSI